MNSYKSVSGHAREVTEAEVREALPWGALKPYQDSAWVACRNEVEGAKWTALSPNQIAAAINVRCEVCVDGVAPRGEANDPGATRYTCPTCNGTGSAHPELLELVRRG